jgi:hypothetical protein
MDYHHHSLLTKLGFAALMGNSALAIYRSRDDPHAVAFVAGAYGGIALLFHFLRRFERGEGAGRVMMDVQYCALAKVGFAVLTCNAALDAYDARRDPGSASFVFVSYVVLVVLIGLFVRAFARGHAGEQGQGQH